MWAVLKFKLPEDQEDLKLAQNGAHLSAVLEDFQNKLRSVVKYDVPVLSTEEAQKIYALGIKKDDLKNIEGLVVQQIREWLWEELADG